MKHVHRPLLITGAAILALTACGPKATEAKDPTTKAGKQTTTAPAEPTTAAGHTSPGMRLKFGERAVVPADYGQERTGVIAITVDSIEKGTQADLDRFPKDQVNGVTPYRIRFTVEFVSGQDLSGLPVTLVGRLADGKRTGIGLAGESADCDSKVAGKDFGTPGVKFETCSLGGAKDGGVVEMAAYNDGDYRENAILWGK